MIKLILLPITGCCTCQPGVAGTTVPARGRDEHWTLIGLGLGYSEIFGLGLDPDSGL